MGISGNRPHGGRRRAAAVVLAAGMLLAACGDSADDATGDSSTNTTGSGPAAAGGGGDAPEAHDPDATLVVTNDGPPNEMDPHREPNTGSRPYWTPVYDTLTNIADPAEPKPALATSWSVSDDGLTWVFELRDDVQFHDSTPLDGAAVALSVNRARTLEGGTQKLDLANVTDVVASGPYEVTFTMATHDPKLPAVLGGPSGAILNPAAIAAGNDFSTTPDGSGPYVAERIVPGERVSFVRAPNPHWDVDAGKLAGFELSLLSEFPVAINGVRSGEIDIAWLIGQNELIEQATAADDDLVVQEFPATTINALYLNNQDPLLADRTVRQALSSAIDREGLANALFSGGADCRPISQNYANETTPLYIEGFDPYPYDPDQARELLDAAGATGETLTIGDIGSTVSRNIAQALQPMLTDVGLNVQLQPGTVDLVQSLQRREVQSLSLTSTISFPHPLIALNRYWMPGGAYPMAEGEHDVLAQTEQVVLNAGSSADEVEAAYDEMAREMADLSVIIPICAPAQRVLKSKDVHGLEEGAVDRINMRYAYVAAED